MFSNQQGPSDRLPKLEREKNKLENELQSLIDEIGTTARESSQKQKELLERKEMIEEKAKRMIQQIDSLDNAAVKQIQNMTTSQSAVCNYVSKISIFLIFAALFYYFIKHWASWKIRGIISEQNQ